MIEKIEKFKFKNLWVSPKRLLYSLATFISVVLVISGIFAAGKLLVDFFNSSKFEGVIKKKYSCTPEDMCEEPWLYNFDIEIKQINQTLNNFKIDLDAYKKYQPGDKYTVIKEHGCNWFRPYDFVLQKWFLWSLISILLLFFGGWGGSFFLAVVLKSERLNFIHDVCATIFFALVGISGMYVVFTDVYTIQFGEKYEATILKKDVYYRKNNEYLLDVNVDELNKRFNRIVVGHDFYNKHKLGEKVFVLVSPYGNSAIIRGGMAYKNAFVSLIFVFLGWFGIFYKISNRLRPREKRFPSKLSKRLEPRTIASIIIPYKEFDLELEAILREVNEKYKKGYKNFCIDIIYGRNVILQVVSPRMFDSRQIDEIGFVVYITFDGKNKDNEKKEFLRMPVSKTFVCSNMIGDMDCYGLNLNNEQDLVVALVKDLLLSIWCVQPRNCKISWWSSQD